MGTSTIPEIGSIQCDKNAVTSRKSSTKAVMKMEGVVVRGGGGGPFGSDRHNGLGGTGGLTAGVGRCSTAVRRLRGKVMAAHHPTNYDALTLLSFIISLLFIHVFFFGKSYRPTWWVLPGFVTCSGLKDVSRVGLQWVLMFYWNWLDLIGVLFGVYQVWLNFPLIWFYWTVLESYTNYFFRL